jgi:aminoglycoside phosphotransferase (APT) family kinase protein
VAERPGPTESNESTDPNAVFSGTMDVPERHRFDVGALAEYLKGKLPDFDGQLRVELFKGGQSNPTYKLYGSRRNFVMRAKPGPVAKLLPSAHAIEREFRVLQALGKTDVPVAEVYALCEDESVIGRAFYVMECVDGRVMWDQSLPDMEPAERRAIYEEMNRVIALLHTVDPAAVGLEDFGRPGNYFARQISRWSKQYKISETEKIEAMDKLIEWMPENIPDTEETSIVHGDYRLDNLIFHPTEPRVLAILDWELSTLGHPLADFSYHCMSWHIEPGKFRGIAGLDHVALGIPTEREYVEMYCQRVGRDPEEVLKHWDFYIAYNMFRLAGILQGIMKRAVDGTASSDKAFESGRRARGLAEAAWRIVERMQPR